MKKSRSIIWLLAVMFVGLFTASCSSDEKQKQDGEEVAEVSFGVNIQDKTTRAMDGECLDDDSLKFLANKGLLKATISVIKATNSTQVAEDIVVPIRYTTSGFVADPIALPRGANKITAFTIHHQNNDLYFSAVSEGGRYSQYVTETLPKTVTIGDNELYKKTTVDIYVLCAVSETAEDFGYIKWNIHFVRLYCLPFSVNVLDEGGNDVIGTGTMKIEKGDYNGTTFSNAVTLSDITFPPATPGALSDICFPYDNQLNPANTYLRFTMTLNENHTTYTEVVSIADLLSYKQQPEWSAEFNYLHLDYPNCKTWFFGNDCSGRCIDNMNLNFTTMTTAQLPGNMQYLNANSVWSHNVIAAGFSINNQILVIPVNSTFRFVDYAKINKTTKTTTITVTAGVVPVTQSSPAFTLSLMDPATGQIIGSKLVSSQGGLGTETFTFHPSDFPAAVNGTCYYMVFHVPADRNIYLADIQVSSSED